MEGTLQDIRYGIRTLTRSPGFTVAAILTLALGIGANGAIFSLVHGVLLQPLAYGEPDRLVAIFSQEGSSTPSRSPTSPANFLDWQRQSGSFETMVGAHPWSPSLTGKGYPEQLSGLRASPELFDLLGVRAALGGTFHATSDGAPGSVVVLGHGLWQRRFGGDPNLVGQSLVLDGEAFEVVGVMPKGFEFPPFWATGAELWAPLSFSPEQAENRRAAYLRVFAKLEPGATLAGARQEMETIATGLQGAYPESNRRLGVHLETLREPVVAPVRSAFWLILAAAGMVLLLACINIAGLLLARGLGRRQEIAVRSALGAGRLRLARQLVTESLLLSLVGGAAGALLSLWGLDLILKLGKDAIPRADEIAFGGPALAFTLTISILTGLAFGLFPAFRTSSQGLGLDSARGSSGGSRGQRRLQGALVVGQVALAMLLVVGAGLVGRSLLQLKNLDPGFRTDHLLTLSIAFAGERYEGQGPQDLFFAEVLKEVRAVPGVRQAGLINHLPIGGDIWGLDFSIAGRPEEEGGLPTASQRVVTPGALEALGVATRQGRFFDEGDRVASVPVVLVNETLALRHFPEGDAVGSQIRLGSPPTLEDEGEGEPWRTVVGVISDTRQWRLTDEIGPEIFFPYGQNPVAWWMHTSLAVHTQGEALAVAESVKNAVWKVDDLLPVSRVKSAGQLLAAEAEEQVLHTWIFGLFAGVSLLLAAIGLYGTLSYQVRLRRRELGIRMAFGARRGSLFGAVALEGLKLAAVGALVGLLAAVALQRVLAGLLFELSPTDPATLVGVTAFVLFVALLACWIPARRAIRVDPVVVLREE